MKSKYFEQVKSKNFPIRLFDDDIFYLHKYSDTDIQSRNDQFNRTDDTEYDSALQGISRAAINRTYLDWYFIREEWK